MFAHRKARADDLHKIVELLMEDELAMGREDKLGLSDNRYMQAFVKINADSNQYLMLVESKNKIIGVCHLSILHSLTFIGSTRMQIEMVRVSKKYRDQNIGRWMINTAIEYGKSKGASIVQLTTNTNRAQAKHFYEDLGFEVTHHGMKLYLDK